MRLHDMYVDNVTFSFMDVALCFPTPLLQAHWQ